MTTTHVGFTTSNICCLPRRAIVPVTARIWLAARQPGFNIGQEVYGRRALRSKLTYIQVWQARMKKAGKVTYTGHETPVSVPAGWALDHHAWHKVHGSAHQEGVGRGISPARGITEVRLHNVKTKEKVCILACHPVSKGYGGARRRASKWAWRNAKLKQYVAYLTRLVKDAHADGYTVLFGGDMNFPKMPTLVAGERVLDHRGLDHLRVLPAAGVRVANVRHKRFKPTRYMDHPILSAQFDLVR